jgi:hypothetical protein
VKAKSVILAGISEKMIRQAQEVLQRLGVNSRVRSYEASGGFSSTPRVMWGLTVKSRDDILKLRSLVKLYANDKDQQLDRLTELQSSKNSRRRSADVRRGYPEAVCFDRIVSVEYAGQQRTYCLTISPTHTVVWNGVLGLNSVLPMGADTNATVVLTGTCDYVKNFFFDSIQANKRVALMRGRVRQDHYQVNWREVAKVAPRYRRYVMRQAIKLGEDSDEFKLSYELLWLLEQGMFTTHEKFEELEDKTMQSVVYAYNGSPVCVGIDCARKKDRTIVTIVWVRWGVKDAAGFLEHRVLNWLDLEATEWETQYWKIKEFLDNYRIYKVAVDTGGLGDVVINRLRHIMPYIEFVDALDSPQESSVRWKYLKQLMDRQKIKWPGGSKVKQRKAFRRFRQEMEDLQMEYKTGGVVKVAAPEEEHAHDDYPNSLAMACMLSADEKGKDDDRVVVYDNPFYPQTRYRR